jgi:HK97 family phage major capsid protein
MPMDLEQLERAAAERAPVEIGPQQRQLQLRVETADVEARTVEVSFSSEHPVARWWGMEILRHTPDAIDMTRAADGLPVLDEHGRQIGIGENVRLVGKRLRALVRFGSSTVAQETLQDVAAGIRKFTSVGYRVKRLLEIEARKLAGADQAKPGEFVMDGWGGPRPAGESRASRWFEAIRWMPMEFSFVSVPADPTVGARTDDQDLRAVPVEWLESRAGNAGAADAPETTKEQDMKRGRDVDAALRGADAGAGSGGGGGGGDDAARTQVTREAEERGAAAERRRVNEVTAVGELHNKELIPRAIAEGWSVERMHQEILAAMPTPEAARQLAGEQESPEIGMSRKEVARYSLCRAILAKAEGRFKGTFEHECARSVGELYGRDGDNLLVPYEVMARALAVEKRADADTTTGTGLVGTELHDEAFIDVLRARTQVVPMGATVMPGLRSTVTFPKQTANSTAGWVAEGAGSGESSITFGVVTISPNTVRARQDITRRLLLQSTPMADAIIMRDLGLRLGIEIDAAAIEGNAANTPTGILYTGSIGDVVCGDPDGAAPVWADLVELETDVATANADVGRLGYLLSPKGRGKLKTVGRKAASDTSSFSMVWTDENTINGYPARASTNVPDDLTKGGGSNLSAVIFGNWSDLIIGMWGTLDIKPDPFSSGDSDTLIIRAFQDVDVAVRHPESFSAIQDADMS